VLIDYRSPSSSVAMIKLSSSYQGGIFVREKEAKKRESFKKALPDERPTSESREECEGVGS